MAPFDFAGVFGDDYLHFYGPDPSPERNAREAEAMWQMLSLQPGRAVLDIGCGQGRIANELARRGARVIGLDASERFLERARADAAATGVEVEYVAGDMRALPWRDHFDAALIWCFARVCQGASRRSAAMTLDVDQSCVPSREASRLPSREAGQRVGTGVSPR